MNASRKPAQTLRNYGDKPVTAKPATSDRGRMNRLSEPAHFEPPRLPQRHRKTTAGPDQPSETRDKNPPKWVKSASNVPKTDLWVV